MNSMICNLICEIGGANVAYSCTSTPTFSVHLALIFRTSKIRLMHCSRLVHFYICEVYYTWQIVDRRYWIEKECSGLQRRVSFRHAAAQLVITPRPRGGASAQAN